jgi:hypothetical protein
MGLELSPEDEIIYQGRVVGRLTYDNDNGGNARICLDVAFACSPGDHIVPLTYLSIGLTKVEPPPSPALIVIQTDPGDFVDAEEAPRLLLEEIVKVRPNIWNFHKNDKDPWPSVLHAHDYEKNLKLDAISGEIFNVTTRKRVGRLNEKKLAAVQAQLLFSKDLGELARSLFGPEEQ